MKHTISALLVASLSLAACTPEKVDPETQQKRVDDVALAFERYVHRYYEARLAEEKKQPGPSTAARLKAREDLKDALRGVGLDMPEGNNLRGALDAVRDLLVAHDYIFLPVSQTDATADDDLGIAFAYVARREPARSQELWGKKVEYKLIVYKPLVTEYPTWRARVLKEEGPMYSPGRFSLARQTIYIDQSYCVKRAQAQPPETQSLGLEGILREVELRQAAYLLFVPEVKDPAKDLERLHEKVLWTAVRYGDPDLAYLDVTGLANNKQFPEPLRVAADKVARQLIVFEPSTTKEQRAALNRKLAEDAWKALQ